MVQFAIVGNRVPYRYFLASGQGESDAGSKGLPAETGSYDAALNSAGIEDANIVKYTSVVPPGAKEISHEEGTRSIRWGEVMEAIMAQANGKAGDTISAAVMITSVHNSKGAYIGSFACEYSGNGTENEAKEALGLSISGMIERRGYGKTAAADVGVGVPAHGGMPACGYQHAFVSPQWLEFFGRVRVAQQEGAIAVVYGDGKRGGVKAGPQLHFSEPVKGRDDLKRVRHRALFRCRGRHRETGRQKGPSQSNTHGDLQSFPIRPARSRNSRKRQWGRHVGSWS